MKGKGCGKLFQIPVIEKDSLTCSVGQRGSQASTNRSHREVDS